MLKPMDNINIYKRKIIAEHIKRCRNIVENSDPERKRIIMTQNEKSNFRNLGLNLKTFLSNSDGEERLVSNIELSNEYLHAPVNTVKNTLFKNHHRGLDKEVVFSILDSVERVADEQFGALEDAEVKKRLVKK